MLKDRFPIQPQDNCSNLEQIEAVAAATSNKLQLAASWYVAMRSKELSGKKPKAVKLFGEDLVAWRDKAGKPVLMDRYCSHMGASLAQGKVTASGCITCPFHGWQYEATGRCTSIPYEKNVPKTAVQRTFPVVERYGYVWAWYGTPEPLFALPEFPPAEQEHRNYMPLRFSFPSQTTARRILENLYDAEHTVALHGIPASEITLKLFGQDATTAKTIQPDLEFPIGASGCWFGAEIDLSIKRYVGFAGRIAQILGLDAEKLTIRVEGWPSGHVVTVLMNGTERFKTLNTITPIEEGRTTQQVLSMITRTGKVGLDLSYYLLFGLQTKMSAAQDVPVWNGLKVDGGGAYTKQDKGVLDFRKFYQEWVDKAVPAVFNTQFIKSTRK